MPRALKWFALHCLVLLLFLFLSILFDFSDLVWMRGFPSNVEVSWLCRNYATLLVQTLSSWFSVKLISVTKFVPNNYHNYFARSRDLFDALDVLWSFGQNKLENVGCQVLQAVNSLMKDYMSCILSTTIAADCKYCQKINHHNQNQWRHWL
jgi:hypothetical protein